MEVVQACSSLKEACQEASVIFFAVPHQYLQRILLEMNESAGARHWFLHTIRCRITSLFHPAVDPSAVGVSLIKGIDYSQDRGAPIQLLSSLIQRQLSLTAVAAVMGANLATQVAKDQVLHVLTLHPSCALTLTLTLVMDTSLRTLPVCGSYSGVRGP